jgi:hypothetical protein
MLANRLGISSERFDSRIGYIDHHLTKQYNGIFREVLHSYFESLYRALFLG